MTNFYDKLAIILIKEGGAWLGNVASMSSGPAGLSLGRIALQHGLRRVRPLA